MKIFLIIPHTEDNDDELVVCEDFDEFVKVCNLFGILQVQISIGKPHFNIPESEYTTAKEYCND